jgi:uncharacterized protein with von Willebrand factor type A (vWA) domain
MTPAARDLVQATVQFCRTLRTRGVAATPDATIEAVRALACIDVADRTEVYLALRAVLTTRVEDWPIFDAVFDECFRIDGAAAAGTPAGWTRRDGPKAIRRPDHIDRRVSADETTSDIVRVPAFGTDEAKRRRDLRGVSHAGVEDVERVARQMARRLAMRRSRRWQPARRGPQIHARRTLRRLLGTGGDPVALSFRRRRIRKSKLIILCDVSGSMDIHSRFLLQFLYAMQGAFARVESFVFSTALARVTEQLRSMTFGRALERLAEVRGFSGGTRIGESLAAFVEGWGDVVDRHTVVVILSDGWDTGDPALLDRALRRIHSRAGRVIWLNPLLGNPDYRPLTRGMQAALPHVDVFAAAHDLESLRAMARHLVV